MKEASFYKTSVTGVVQCFLCPHHCRLKPTEEGRCKVRVNHDGRLIAKGFGLFSALHIDPVEKKPFYHFYPGKKILSVGSFGCNLHCEFCQNWEISQNFPEYPDAFSLMSASDLIKKATEIKENLGLAFTYNEPVVNYEFISEMAVKAKDAGLKTAMITNGFIAEKPLKQLLPFIDAFNVDLKVFSDNLYRSYSGGRLNPVLRTLKTIRNGGQHLEITHLVVTGMSDNMLLFNTMTDWIRNELGELTVLHISRYFPNYRMSQPPTSPSVLSYMYEKAQQKLPYTYLGNIIFSGTSDTYCHSCQAKVIERHAYDINITGLNEKGNCVGCGQNILQYC